MNKCSVCEEEIPRGGVQWEQIHGWEQRRAQGGTNYVALRQPTGKLMCGSCMVLLRSGQHAGQEQLA